MQPTKKPTAAEWKVAGCLFLTVPFLIGIVLIILGYNAAPEKVELGRRVSSFGWIFIFFSLIFFILWRLIQKYIRGE
jgi:drug/metabolite transporter superfamily protein YnfA